MCLSDVYADGTFCAPIMSLLKAARRPVADDPKRLMAYLDPPPIIVTPGKPDMQQRLQQLYETKGTFSRFAGVYRIIQFTKDMYPLQAA